MFYEVASLFRDAYEKTATMAEASSGFRSTGIWPFNPDVFDEAEFAQSSVTDKSLSSTTDLNDNMPVTTSHTEEGRFISI